MIHPIDHQLSFWKMEQNAQNHKDPSSSAQQALQSEAAVEEAEHKNTSVQTGEESAESQRPGVGDRDAGKNGRHGGGGKRGSRDDDGDESEKSGGFEFYA